VNYHLGVDAFPSCHLLNSFITVLVVIAGWEVIRTRCPVHGGVSGHVGAFETHFAALDAVLFYVFFEAT